MPQQKRPASTALVAVAASCTWAVPPVATAAFHVIENDGAQKGAIRLVSSVLFRPDWIASLDAGSPRRLTKVKLVRSHRTETAPVRPVSLARTRPKKSSMIFGSRICPVRRSLQLAPMRGRSGSLSSMPSTSTRHSAPRASTSQKKCRRRLRRSVSSSCSLSKFIQFFQASAPWCCFGVPSGQRSTLSSERPRTLARPAPRAAFFDEEEEEEDVVVAPVASVASVDSTRETAPCLFPGSSPPRPPPPSPSADNTAAQTRARADARPQDARIGAHSQVLTVLNVFPQKNLSLSARREPLVPSHLPHARGRPPKRGMFWRASNPKAPGRRGGVVTGARGGGARGLWEGKSEARRRLWVSVGAGACTAVSSIQVEACQGVCRFSFFFFPFFVLFFPLWCFSRVFFGGWWVCIRPSEISPAPKKITPRDMSPAKGGTGGLCRGVAAA